jgi:hypothetical protein
MGFRGSFANHNYEKGLEVTGPLGSSQASTAEEGLKLEVTQYRLMPMGPSPWLVRAYKWPSKEFRGSQTIAQLMRTSRLPMRRCIRLQELRGGSFKEIENSKVYLTKVWFGLSRLSWTRSP